MIKHNLKGIPAEQCILGTNYTKKRDKKEKQNGHKVHSINYIIKTFFKEFALFAHK